LPNEDVHATRDAVPSALETGCPEELDVDVGGEGLGADVEDGTPGSVPAGVA
jgi:hypothetical protein